MQSLRDYIEKTGNLDLGINKKDLFSFIVFNIVGQMLFIKAADTIFNRISELTNGNIAHITILSLDRIMLQSCGLSSRKAEAIIQLSENLNNGSLNLDEFYKMDENSAINLLTQIKGVGIWTAEMILMFGFKKNNIFSCSDIALRNGIMKVHDEYKTFSKTRFRYLKKMYSPYGEYSCFF